MIRPHSGIEGSDMKNRPYSWIFTTAIVLVGLSIALTGSAAAQSADIVVSTDGSGDYTSIQNAVDNATEGEKIRVESGTYEQHTEVDKNVTLYAPNGATISNTSAVVSKYGRVDVRSGFQIYGDFTPTISGFTLIDWQRAISAGGANAGFTVDNTEVVGGNCGICAAGTPGNWTVQNSTIDVDYDEAAISGYDSSGSWSIKNTTISNGQILADLSSGNPLIQNVEYRAFEEGIDFDDAPGSPTIRNVTFENSTGEAIEIDNSSGYVTISNVTVQDLEQGSEDAITADKSSGTIDVSNIHIQTVRNGIDAEKSTSKWSINNITVQDTEGDGIDASNSTGNWIVREGEFRNMGDKSIDVIDSEGSWQIHQSILTGGSEGTLDAWDAKRMINASHNYWGAADGPSETFCGSGGAIGGYNVTMYPYYTDSSLTTLSSATTGGTVQIASSCVIPEDISESNEQDLVLTLSQISADGQSDNITITMPEGVSVEKVNQPRAIGTPYEVNVTNSGGPIKLEVNPDEPETTVDFVLRVPVELSSNGA
jgi:hypothetical protein